MPGKKREEEEPTAIREKDRWLRILGVKKETEMAEEPVAEVKPEAGKPQAKKNPRLEKLEQKFLAERQNWTDIIEARDSQIATLKMELAKKTDQLRAAQAALTQKEKEMGDALMRKEEEINVLRKKLTDEAKEKETAYMREMEQWVDSLTQARQGLESKG